MSVLYNFTEWRPLPSIAAVRITLLYHFTCQRIVTQKGTGAKSLISSHREIMHTTMTNPSSIW